MPEWAQFIDRLNPIFYFMKVMRMIVLKGSGFLDLLEEMVSLFMLGATFLSLAIWRYRKTA
jgi:ABC-2 type transport system permease protein